MQSVHARRQGHEFAVHAGQAAAAQTNFGVFEDRGTAQRFQTDDVTYETGVGRFQLLAITAAAEGVADQVDKGGKACANDADESGGTGLRQYQRADYGGTENAERDGGYPVHDGVEA